MTLVDDFASYIGMPSWFGGGLLGLAILYIILALFSKYFRLSNFAAIAMTLSLCFANVFLFYWPWYIALMAGILLLHQLNVIPSFQSGGMA